MSQDIRFAAAQSRGGRSNQEDYCEVLADGELIGAQQGHCAGRSASDLIAALCDGMGGHNAGDVAAKTACNTFIAAFKSGARGAAPASLAGACRAANAALTAQMERTQSLTGMGTTLVAIRVTRGQLAWVSVGDSGLYLYRNGHIDRLNQDHSMRPVIKQMVVAGILAPDEALHHPDRNALRSALCGEDVPLVDIGEPPMKLKRGDILVLASDGMETLPRSRIETILGSRVFRSPSAMARRIVAECVKAGGRGQDNTTVAVIRVKK